MVLQRSSTKESADAEISQAGNSGEFWRVYLVPSPDHTLSAFMDLPRVFAGSRSECERQFKAFYGIRNTVHEIASEQATDVDFATQQAADAREAEKRKA